MIVIDTQALVWLFQQDERLGPAARGVIERARNDGGVILPAIMAWEVAMLVDRGRLVLGMAPGSWFARIMAAEGFRWGRLDVATGVDAGTLPGDIHGDPADRLVIATARQTRCPVLTADRKILAYAAAGHVAAIDAGA